MRTSTSGPRGTAESRGSRTRPTRWFILPFVTAAVHTRSSGDSNRNVTNRTRDRARHILWTDDGGIERKDHWGRVVFLPRAHRSPLISALLDERCSPFFLPVRRKTSYFRFARFACLPPHSPPPSSRPFCVLRSRGQSKQRRRTAGWRGFLRPPRFNDGYKRRWREGEKWPRAYTMGFICSDRVADTKCEFGQYANARA